MSAWTQLAIVIAISLPIGIALRFYLTYRHRQQVDRLKRIGQTMSWPYYAAGTVFFSALAVGSIERLPFLIFFSAFGSLNLFLTVRVFLRERTKYSLLHLLIAITCAAIFAGFCRWFGMAMAVVSGVSAAAVVLVLFALEWARHKTRPEPPASDT